MKAKFPSFGAYVVLHNAESNGYPWRECIKNALTFCDKVYILEVDSTPEDVKAIYDEFHNVPNVVMKRLEGVWDMDNMAIVGQMKQAARQLVKEDYCIYLDSDEILQVKNKEILVDLILNNTGVDVFSLPYITFFGSPYQVAFFQNMENWWRWKIFRNLPHIGHGVHGAARKYDENGKMYMDKSISDGCELINMQTLEVMQSLLFMPPGYIQAGQAYMALNPDETVQSKITTIFSEVLNDFPIICLHYGWVDFLKKATNGVKYWTKTKAFKTGVEHSRLFDGLSSEQEAIDKKIAEWSSLPTLPLHVKGHPSIIMNTLADVRPKILTVSLASHGPFGVPMWNRLLKKQLSEYDVQNLAFNNYVAGVPAEASEIDKAKSFTAWIQQSRLDANAAVIFADGFWAATYTGKAKVVSVIHGLWSHPLRDKWDDGLFEERKKLAAYQLEYYKKAKDLGHTLICVSPFIHKILKDEHGIDSILISNAIDLEVFDNIKITHMEKDRPLILHGITSNNKGLDILQAIENHPLIKDRFDIASIDEIAKHANVSKEVVFKIADVAFLPTKWEASSYLLLECLANNLTIAAYKAGILNCDLPRMEGIGIVVDKYDVDTFATALVQAYEGASKYKCGRLFLKENGMTIDKWTADLKRLVYEVL